MKRLYKIILLAITLTLISCSVWNGQPYSDYGEPYHTHPFWHPVHSYHTVHIGNHSTGNHTGNRYTGHSGRR
jgi:hypothetical protein